MIPDVRGRLILTDQWVPTLRLAAAETKRFDLATSGVGAGASKSIGTATVAVSSFTDNLARSAKNIGGIMTLGLTVPIVAAFAGVAAATFKLGVDAIETENLVKVSFGGMKKAADEWSKGLSASLGLNEFEMRKTAGTLFNMTTNLGLAKDEAFKMSTGVVELAADMASFRNIKMEDALYKITAGLVGQSRPLKDIGILVQANDVKQEAYRTGIAKLGSELTSVQKVQARWSAILRQTTNDQGDLARTLDSPANKLRIMEERIKGAATELGVSMMPVFTLFVDKVIAASKHLSDLMQWFARLPHSTQTAAIGFAGVTAAIGPAVWIAGTLISNIQKIIPLLTPGVDTAARAASTALGVTGFTGAVSGLASAIMSPAGLVAGLGALAFVWSQIQVSEINAKTEALRHAQEVLANAGGKPITPPTPGGFTPAPRQGADQILDLAAAFEAGTKGLKMAKDGVTAATIEMAQTYAQGALAGGKMAAQVTSVVIPALAEQNTKAKEYNEIAKSRLSLEDAARLKARDFPKAGGGTSATIASFVPPKEELDTFRKQLAEVNAQLDKLTKSELAEIEAARLLGGPALKEALQKYQLEESSLNVLTQRTKDYKANTKDAAAETAKWVKQMEKNAKAHDEAAEILFKANQGVKKYVVDQRELKDVISATIPDEITYKWRDWTSHIEDNFDRLKLYAKFVDDDFAAVWDHVGVVLDSTARKHKRLSEEMERNIQIGKRLADILMSAFQRGGTGEDIGKDIGGGLGQWGGEKLGGLLASRIGGLAGGIAGSFLGPLGSMAGAWLGGKIGGLFSSAGKKVNDMRDQFLETFGGTGTGAGSGFNTLSSRLHEIGKTGDEMFTRLRKAATESEFKDAMDDITKALDDFKAKAEKTAKEAEEKKAKILGIGVGMIQEIMSPEEIKALAKAYRVAQLEGFEGSEQDFLQQQLEFYNTLGEEDERLKTWFSENTVSAFNLLKSGQMKQFAGITEGLKGLQAEYTSLFDSIKDEMPEKEMGVVESNVRKRMEEVSKEKLSLEQELKDALKRVSETEVDPIRIPYEFYEVGGITGGMSLPHPNPKPNESPTTTPGIPPTLTANFIVDGRTMAKASAAPLAKYMELNGVAAA